MSYSPEMTTLTSSRCPYCRHHDNDWYRQFLDSSGNAITVIHCFTDIPPRGGGTYLCEDGLTNICQTLLDHPEGFEPPLDLYSHIPDCKKFVTVSLFASRKTK